MSTNFLCLIKVFVLLHDCNVLCIVIMGLWHRVWHDVHGMMYLQEVSESELTELFQTADGSIKLPCFPVAVGLRGMKKYNLTTVY